MSPCKSICPLCQVLVLMQLVALSTPGCWSMLITSSLRISIRVSSNWTNTQPHHSFINRCVSMREFGFPYLTQECTLIRSPIFGRLWDGYCYIFRGGYAWSLAMKKRWQEERKAADKDHFHPNIVLSRMLKSLLRNSQG